MVIALLAVDSEYHLPVLLAERIKQNIKYVLVVVMVLVIVMIVVLVLLSLAIV